MKTPRDPGGRVVRFLARSGLGPASRSGRAPRAKDATTAISRQRNSRRSASVRAGLLWGLALIGLLLLPSDYRAGAEAAHGHALMHLWLDAADGAVYHHHEPVSQGATWDWLDPAVADSEPTASASARGALPDVGERHDSVPTGGVHLLVQAVVFLVLATAPTAPLAAPCRAPGGQVVSVLLPPPRWTPLAG